MDRIFAIAGIVAMLAFYGYRFGKGFLEARREARSNPAGRARSSGPTNAECAAELGFLPAERLDTSLPGAPDPRETAALDAVRAGDWQAGARYLAEAGRDWEERDRRSTLLAKAAVQDDSWLLAWRTALPQDPAAALVNAESLIKLAWEVRGSKGSRHTTHEQFANFHRVLEQARGACREAQAMGGEDPCPWIVEIPLAMGLGYPHDHFRQLWAEVVRRDPGHLAAHLAALQYWCQKWRGSHDAALAFAREAAATGAPGRLLAVLPLFARYEFQIADDGVDRDVYYKQPEVVAETEAALAAVTAAATAYPHDPRLPRARHMLAHHLYWADRYEAAVEQFRLVDGYIDAMPWSYCVDPLKEYVHNRNYAAAQVVKAGV